MHTAFSTAYLSSFRGQYTDSGAGALYCLPMRLCTFHFKLEKCKVSTFIITISTISLITVNILGQQLSKSTFSDTCRTLLLFSYPIYLLLRDDLK
jgi:hypothetical protein